MVKTYYKTTWYSQKQIRYFRMRIDYLHSSMKWVVYSTFSLIPVQLISGHPRWFSALPCIASSFNARRSYRIQCFRVVPFLHIIRLFVWDNAFVTHGQHMLMAKKILWSIAHCQYRLLRSCRGTFRFRAWNGWNVGAVLWSWKCPSYHLIDL